jgi:hypothetical protein
VARQPLGRHVPVATNTRDNRRNIGDVVFYVVRVILKESVGLSVNPPTVTKQRLCKHVPATTKN